MFIIVNFNTFWQLKILTKSELAKMTLLCLPYHTFMLFLLIVIYCNYSNNCNYRSSIYFSRKSERIAGTALINGLILSFSKKQQSQTETDHELSRASMARGLDLDDPYGPFQPKPHSMPLQYQV